MEPQTSSDETKGNNSLQSLDVPGAQAIVNDSRKEILEDLEIGEVLGLDSAEWLRDYILAFTSQTITTITSTSRSEVISSITDTSALSVSPNLPLIAVGTECGSVLIYFVNQVVGPCELHLKHQICLSNSVPVVKIVWAHLFRSLLCSTGDGRLYYLALISQPKEETILQHIEFKGKLVSVSRVLNENKFLLCTSTSSIHAAADTIVVKSVSAGGRELGQEAVHRLRLPATCVISWSPNSFLAASYHDRSLVLWAAEPGRERCRLSQQCSPSHDLAVTQLHQCSPDAVLSVAKDGFVVLTDLGPQRQQPLAIRVFKGNRQFSPSFVTDSQGRVVVAFRGGTRKFSLPQCRSDAPQSKWSRLKASSAFNDAVAHYLLQPSLTFEAGMVRFEEQIQAASREQESLKYQSAREQLQQELKELKEEVKRMLDANGAASPLERLEDKEFALDPDLLSRLQSNGRSKVTHLRHQHRKQEVSDDYLIKVLKEKYCSVGITQPEVLLLPFLGRRITSSGKQQRDDLLDDTKSPSVIVANFPIDVDEAQLRRCTAVFKDRQEETRKVSMSHRKFLDKYAMASYGLKSDLLIKHGAHNLFPDVELTTVDKKSKQRAILFYLIHQFKSQFNQEFAGLLAKKRECIDEISAKINRQKFIIEEFQAFGMIELEKKCIVQAKPTLDVVEDPLQFLFDVPSDQMISEKPVSQSHVKNQGERQSVSRSVPTIQATMSLKHSHTTDADGVTVLLTKTREAMMGPVLLPSYEQQLKEDVPLPKRIRGKPSQEYDAEDQEVFRTYKEAVAKRHQRRKDYCSQLFGEFEKLNQEILHLKERFDAKLRKLYQERRVIEVFVARFEYADARLLNESIDEEQFSWRVAELQSELDKLELEKSKIVEVVEKARHSLRAVEAKVRHFEKALEKLDKEFDSATGSLPVHIINVLRSIYQAIGPKRSRPDSIKDDVWRQVIELKEERRLKMAEVEAIRRGKEEQDKIFQAENKIWEDFDQVVTAHRNLLEETRRTLDSYHVDPFIQLVVPQGRVERVLASSDLSAAVCADDLSFLRESTLQALNDQLRNVIQQRNSVARKSFHVRVEWSHLEWEKKREVMIVEDLLNKLRSIETFPVTKKKLTFIQRRGSVRSDVADELNRLLHRDQLEDEFQAMNSLRHGKRVMSLKARIAQKQKQNLDLDREISAIQSNLQSYGTEEEETKETKEWAAGRFELVRQEKQLREMLQIQRSRLRQLLRELDREKMASFPQL